MSNATPRLLRDAALLPPFARELSAHSDVASLLVESCAGIPGIAVVCADPARYVAVGVLLRGRCFAVAHGMGTVAIRLTGESRDQALAAGATPVEGASDWVALRCWDGSGREPDLKAWLSEAANAS